MTQTEGKFSIIIPYYNGKKFIRETVESVLSQTYGDFELLIIDDGSPDKEDADLLTGLVASKNDLRIKHMRKDNGGLSDSRNYGIAHSDGEFIAFIDQDDLWDKDKLALQAEVFILNPKVNFISTDARTFGDKIGEIRIGERHGLKGGLVPDTFGKMLRGNFVACSSVAFRRAVIPSVGYCNTAYSVVTDYEYFLRFSAKMDFYFLAKSLLSYRLHEGNTTKQRVKGAREVVSVLSSQKPHTFLNRINLAVNMFKQVALIWWLCLRR